MHKIILAHVHEIAAQVAKFTFFRSLALRVQMFRIFTRRGYKTTLLRQHIEAVQGPDRAGLQANPHGIAFSRRAGETRPKTFSRGMICFCPCCHQVVKIDRSYREQPCSNSCMPC